MKKTKTKTKTAETKRAEPEPTAEPGAPVPEIPGAADEREAIFEKPIAEPVEVVKEAKAPPKIEKTPGIEPSADHVLVATWIVAGTSWVGDRIHKVDLPTEEKARGIRSWAEALALNMPDLKGGPILTLVAASVWSLGLLAERYKMRLDEKQAKPVQAEPVEPPEEKIA